MWLLTTFGFFSVVQKRGDDVLTVRTRVAGDLDKLRTRYLPTLGSTLAHAGTDYRYRATIDREELAAAMPNIVRDITYSNFKSAVAAQQGHRRSHIYHDVWAALTKLEAIDTDKDQGTTRDGQR